MAVDRDTKSKTESRNSPSYQNTYIIEETRSAAMDWMLTHQLSSKNLSVNERMAMVADFKDEVKRDNEKKRKETEGRPLKNCTPIGVQNSQDNSIKNEGRIHSDTWTDSQTAKKAGVGVGTCSIA